LFAVGVLQATMSSREEEERRKQKPATSC